MIQPGAPEQPSDPETDPLLARIGPVVVAGVLGAVVIALLLTTDPAPPGVSPAGPSTPFERPRVNSPEPRCVEPEPPEVAPADAAPPAPDPPATTSRDPSLASLDGRLVWVDAPPHRIAQEYPVERGPYGRSDSPTDQLNRLRREKAERFASRQALILVEARRRFRELFADPLDLPDLEEEGVRLQVLTLWDAAAQRDWMAEHGRGETALHERQYVPGTGWVVSHVGSDTLRSQDRLRCASDRVQRFFDQDTARLGIVQLLDAHARGSDPRARDLDPLSLWIVAGISSLVAGFEHDEGAEESLEGESWHHGRLLLAHVRALRSNRRRGNRWWTLRELVEPADDLELRLRARRRFPTENADRMAEVFHAQAWAFAHFCRHYDGGKYGAQLRECLRREMRGERGEDALAAAFGLSGSGDWEALEDEYAWYRLQCAGRRVGRRIDPRTGVQVGWHRPDTSPPTGAMPTEADTSEYDD